MAVGLVAAVLTPTGIGAALAGGVSGPVTVTRDGSVVDGRRIDGYLDIRADGVRIINSSIRHDGEYAIRIFEGHTGTVVEDTTVHCLGGETKGLVFGNYTARRVRVHGCAAGFLHSAAAPATITESMWNGRSVSADDSGASSSSSASSSASDGATRVGRAQASRTRTGGARAAGTSASAGATSDTRESYPGPGNTGVPDGTVLRRSGSLTLATDGQVIDGLDIVGCVLVTADNVVIRRSRISCNDIYSIRTLYASNLLVEDVQIDGRGVNQAAVCCSGYTLRRLDISNAIDGPRMASNTLVEDSWIHHLSRRSGSHNDALQTTGATNVTIRRNALEAYHPGTDDPMNACLMVGSTTAPIVSNLIFEGNYCNGGNYSIGIRPDLNAANVRMRGNTFGRDHRYGVVAGPHPGVSWDSSTNIYLDNRSPVPH